VTAIPHSKPLKAKKRRPVAPHDALLRLIEKTLDDGKAEEIAVIDLENKSTLADYMVIASGRSQRQVTALAERLLDALRSADYRHLSVEGLQHGEWVLVDAGDVIVHLFRPEQRVHYNLEKMWGESFATLDESIA
jgi:ribosome silencing factor RsfS/YbeB/iojap